MVAIVLLRLCSFLCIVTVYCAYQHDFLDYERDHYKLPECKRMKVEIVGALWYLTNWVVKSCVNRSSLQFIFFFC